MTSAKSLSSEILRRLGPGDADASEKHKAYLKSDLKHLGISMPEMRKLTKALEKQYGQLPHEALRELVLELWSGEFFEQKMMAALWLCQRRATLQPNDMKLLRRLIASANTWALVDPLAIEAAGEVAARYSVTATLDLWAEDDDFWVRRAAMLALLKPLRKGAGDFTQFTRYAEPMLHEREFFIRKAIGWILRERCKKCPQEVYDWVLPRAHEMSGLTRREAIRKLSLAQQNAINDAVGRRK